MFCNNSIWFIPTDNLVLLGRIAAVFGDLPGELSPSEHTALREISSPDYSRYSTTGFKVTVGFLVHPDPLWRIQNHDYPAIWLNKKGWRYGNFDKPVSASGIDIKLVDTTKDGAIVLSVNNSNEIFDKGQSKYVNGLIIKDSEAFKQANNQCCCTDLLKFL